MSSRVSPLANQVYGIKRICQAWSISSSTFYRFLKGPKKGRKRGPKPVHDDTTIVDLVREDIALSPFKGEGHRKVHARLRRKGVTVGRQRVLNLMRQERLLSPNRVPSRPSKNHSGKIVTSEPDQIWATDGSKIFTQDDGWVWLFTVNEHWNSECLGFHVTKKGNRFAALDPIASSLLKRFGSVERGVATGLQLSLRMDNGPQYRSDDFKSQIKSWGIHPSYGLVREPETNGVVERFYRTLKEQVIYGRVFKNIEEVREVVATFIKSYNESWLLEKLGYLSPLEARADWEAQHAA